MALPANWSTRVVTGKYIGTDGNPVSGRIKFTPRASRLVDANALTMLVGRTIAVELDSAGAFSITLPVTNDTDVVPLDFTYLVDEEFTGGQKYSIEVPSSGSPLDLSAVSPVPASSGSAPAPTGGMSAEEIRDLVAATLVQGTNVTIAHDDNANTITISAAGGGGTGDGHTHLNKAILDATTASFTTADESKLDGIATGATANATNAQLRDRSTHTGTQTSASISDLTEVIQDTVAAFLAEGTNVTLAYNDAGNSLSITAAGGAGGGLDAEGARDALGVALVGVGNITVTVNDAADTITISTTATANSTDAALRDRSTHTGTQSADTVVDGTTNKAYTATEKSKLAGIAAGATTDATINAHLAAAAGAHAASAISFSPTGTVAATTVQNAIAEVALESLKSGGTWTAAVYPPNAVVNYAGGAFINSSGVNTLTTDEPGVSPKWTVFVEKGATGTPGAPGPMGDQYTATQAAGTLTIDPTNGTEQFITLTGNITLSVDDSAWPDNVGVTVYFIQDATGGRTITRSGSIPWSVPNTITHDTAANHYSAVTIWKANFPTTGPAYIIRHVAYGDRP